MPATYPAAERLMEIATPLNTAPNCLLVSSRGDHVLCQGAANNCFLIEDIPLQEGFEIVQGIFDYYNVWEANILRLASEMKFQELIDSCHLIFHNPITLIDGNYQVIAISSFYGEDDVNEEWRYMKKFGFNSMDIIDFLKGFGQTTDHSLINKPQILSPDSPILGKRLANVKLFWNNTLCGRIVVLEKDRPLNSGDLQTLSYLQSVLAPYLAQSAISDAGSSFKDIFSEIITLGKVDPLLLEKHISYLHWNEAREFRLLIIQPYSRYDNDIFLHQLRRTILKIFPFSSTNIIEQSMVIILKSQDLPICPPDMLADTLMLHGKAFIGVSLPFQDLTKLHYYYDQTSYALERGAENGAAQAKTVFYAFDTMIPYIICSANPGGILYACHPEVLKLARLDEAEGSDYIRLLKAYIDNQKNTSSTAKALYMHRNTLAYRLEKLDSLLDADLDDPYERDYLKLSIYILEIVKGG